MPISHRYFNISVLVLLFKETLHPSWLTGYISCTLPLKEQINLEQEDQYAYFYSFVVWKGLN